MSDSKKTNETELTPDGAVEIQDEHLDTASGGASDYLLTIGGVKGEGKTLGAGGLKFGDGSVRGIKFNPAGKP